MSGDSAAGSLRQALAIAVVRSKRQHATEAAELRARAERAEAQLRQQQQQHTQLQEWAASLLRLTTGSSSPGHSHALADDERGPGVITTTCSAGTTSAASPRRSDSIFLPPLTLSLPGPGSDGPAAAAEALQLQDGYQQLHEQLALSAAAAATGSGGGAAGAASAEVQGRAATLGAMLLHNLRMLQLLQPPAPGTQHASSGTGHAQGSKAAAIDDLSSFVSSTLLHAPKSSLSAAYARQCAALLAALLTPGAAPPAQPAHEQPRALAAQAVQLLQHVMRTRLAPELGPPPPASLLAAAGPSSRQPALSAAAAATALLQEMSAFPSTALLMALVTAQQLAALVQQQQEAWPGLQAAAEPATPAPPGWRPCLQDAASTSAAAFQASFAVVDDLVGLPRQQGRSWVVQAALRMPCMILHGCCWAGACHLLILPDGVTPPC